MGGRFGKYGDAKRKAQIRKNRLEPATPPKKKAKETDGRKSKWVRGRRDKSLAKP
jgi:hypothetical protein